MFPDTEELEEYYELSGEYGMGEITEPTKGLFWLKIISQNNI